MIRVVASVLALVLLLATTPGLASVQRIPRVAVLLFGTAESDANFGAFRAALRDLGHVAGKTISLDVRGAQGQPGRLAELPAEIVATRPDVIVVLGGDGALFTKQATRTIPIVSVVSYDPVEQGLVASFARPGGNVTGAAYVSAETAGKRLQFIREALPGVSRLGVLWNPDHPDGEYRNSVEAGRTFGMTVVSLEVRRAEDFDAAFQAIERERLAAIVVAASRFMNGNRTRIMEFATARRLPVISGWGPWTDGGGLLSYGPDIDDLVRRAAAQVDRVLKGTRPADLPFELPTKFELVLNMRAAQTLGVSISPALRLQAARVIE